MVKYCVYVDESGDFHTDAEAPRKNPSLVGGFFRKDDRDFPADSFINKIENRIKGKNHSTELENDKGTTVYQLLKLAKTFPIEFVIFQNQERETIIDSTRTYLNVLAEGLIQLLKALVILEGDKIELNVVAGFKKDTTQEVTASSVEGYIGMEAYQERVSEKLTIEKAKLRHPLIQGSAIRIRLADDKRDPNLVLCDYICNFWYTRPARAFDGTVPNGTVSLRSALTAFYNPAYHFSLAPAEEQNHVLKMMQDGSFADALFEICCGILSAKNAELVEKHFFGLPNKEIHSQLGNLAGYIGDLMVFRKSRELILRVLNGAEALYGRLKEADHEDLKFYLDIQLYRLAYQSNFCRGEGMEVIMQAIEPDIARYTMQTMDMDYLLIYYIRRAVYCLDRQQYRMACKICDDMELLLQMVAETLSGNECIRLEGELHSEWLGKVLGTKLQAQIGLCARQEETLANARETSDRAIAQFRYPIDLNRQYQYRAELEAVAGDAAAALSWMEKSFGGKLWQQRIANKPQIYDLYNLLFVAAFTKDTEQETSRAIAAQISKNCMSIIDASPEAAETCRLLLGCALSDRTSGQALLRGLTENSGTEHAKHLAQAAAAILNGAGAEALFA